VEILAFKENYKLDVSGIKDNDSFWLKDRESIEEEGELVDIVNVTGDKLVYVRQKQIKLRYNDKVLSEFTYLQGADTEVEGERVALLNPCISYYASSRPR
jgi:hypothetical protein